MTRPQEVILKVFDVKTQTGDFTNRGTRDAKEDVWAVQESGGALRATVRLGGRWKLDVAGRKRPEPEDVEKSRSAGLAE